MYDNGDLGCFTITTWITHKCLSPPTYALNEVKKEDGNTNGRHYFFMVELKILPSFAKEKVQSLQKSTRKLQALPAAYYILHIKKDFFTYVKGPLQEMFTVHWKDIVQDKWCRLYKLINR